MGVYIQQQYAFAAAGDKPTQSYSRSGFTHPTLLICNSQNPHGKTSQASLKRQGADIFMIISATAISMPQADDAVIRPIILLAQLSS